MLWPITQFAVKIAPGLCIHPSKSGAGYEAGVGLLRD